MNSKNPFGGGPHRCIYRRVTHDISKLIKLQNYAEANHLNISGVRNRLQSGKLFGYKLGGCWWIVDTTSIED